MIEIHCSKPSECKYLLFNPIYTYHIARTNQLVIFEIYRTSNNFIIKGDATDFIKKWADSKGVEILSLELQSIPDFDSQIFASL